LSKNTPSSNLFLLFFSAVLQKAPFPNPPKPVHLFTPPTEWAPNKATASLALKPNLEKKLRCAAMSKEFLGLSFKK